MFVDHDPNRKGNVAELMIAAEAAKLGIDVLQPMTEHARYDLVFDTYGSLIRVQCKWGVLKDEVVCARLSTSRHTPSGYVVGTYAPEEIDAVRHLLRGVEEVLLGSDRHRCGTTHDPDARRTAQKWPTGVVTLGR